MLICWQFKPFHFWAKKLHHLVHDCVNWSNSCPTCPTMSDDRQVFRLAFWFWAVMTHGTRLQPQPWLTVLAWNENQTFDWHGPFSVGPWWHLARGFHQNHDLDCESQSAGTYKVRTKSTKTRVWLVRRPPTTFDYIAIGHGTWHRTAVCNCKGQSKCQGQGCSKIPHAADQ